MATQKHFIWSLYEALADTNSMTEPEGRAKIKEVLPHLADIVDYVIETKGDMKSAQAAETLVRSHTMSDKIREQFAALKGGGSGGNGAASKGVINGATSNDDMNANLRNFASSGKLK